MLQLTFNPWVNVNRLSNNPAQIHEQWISLCRTILYVIELSRCICVV